MEHECKICGATAEEAKLKIHPGSVFCWDCYMEILPILPIWTNWADLEYLS